jgi:hypothetical protein
MAVLFDPFLLIVVKLDRATEVVGSTVDIWTRNFHLFETVEMLLQYGKELKITAGTPPR